MENQIYGVELTPTGVAVDIQGFGVWGLSHDDVDVLRNGDHLLRGTWPEHEAWCNEAWMTYADELVANLIDAAIAKAVANLIGATIVKATGGAP